jgi:hypothetical protein
MMASNQSQADLIPWQWYLQPTVPIYACPSPTAILTTFFIINVLVSLLNLILGHRKIVNFITFGLFRKPLGNTWWFMFLLPLGI